MKYKVLAINPGSTSTKIAVYEEKDKKFETSISHTAEELAPFGDVLDQFEFREKIILSVLKKESIDASELSAVVGRGGMLPNMRPGGYAVNQAMIDTFKQGLTSPHASNLGALLARQIAAPLGIPAFIYDSVTSDELAEVARITGMPDVTKHSMCHVLNMKAVARKTAEKYGKKYEELDFLIAHLGGGISLSVHNKGRIIDCIRDDEGPFAPERSGGIPALYMINLCYDGNFTKKEMVKKVRGNAGIKGYLGTQDLRDVESMIEEGDEKAKLVYEALAYQVAKGIGELSVVLNGKFDYIILTGGMAYSKKLTALIQERVGFIGKLEIVPGENEMEALVCGALRLLRGEEEVKVFKHLCKEEKR